MDFNSHLILASLCVGGVFLIALTNCVPFVGLVFSISMIVAFVTVMAVRNFITDYELRDVE